MEIKKIAIAGMGALGLLYGAHMQNKEKELSVCFVMDRERLARHKKDIYKVNGQEMAFSMVCGNEAEPADLFIAATKYTGLREALEMARPAIDEHTVIISVLNGIVSEEIIAEKYGDNNLVYCVAEGMDAMREGTALNYTRMGQLRIGALKESQQSAADKLERFFSRIEMPYTRDKEILRSMWGKFMLNVGINQTCMVYRTTYQGALHDEKIRSTMFAAMNEVMKIGRAEGIHLTGEDMDYYVGLLYTLKPDGYPSMRQDALARRKSEVDMFAGTVIKLAQKHGIDVPVNRMYYEKIKEIEAGY